MASTKLTSVTAARSVRTAVTPLDWTMEFSWPQEERATPTERHSEPNLQGTVTLSPAAVGKTIHKQFQ